MRVKKSSPGLQVIHRHNSNICRGNMYSDKVPTSILSFLGGFLALELHTGQQLTSKLAAMSQIMLVGTRL